MTEIFLLDVSGLSDDKLFSRYYDNLSEYRKEKTNRYRIRKDKNLSLGAGILIDRYLRKFGFCEKNMQYISGEKGKPFFKDFDCFFNLSHSGEIVICVFSENEIGCDIQICCDKFPKNMTKRFFTKYEYNFIINSNKQAESFSRIWSLKESYLKFTGDGLSGGLNSFEIRFSYNKPSVYKDNKNTGIYFKEYKFKNYFISICCDDINFNDTLKIISI